MWRSEGMGRDWGAVGNWSGEGLWGRKGMCRDWEESGCGARGGLGGGLWGREGQWRIGIGGEVGQERDEEDWVDSGCGACGAGKGCGPLPFSVPQVLGCGETKGHPRD